MSPTQIASVALAAVLAACGAILVKDPATLGLDPVVTAWLGIVIVALAPVQAALQSETVQRTVWLRR